MVAFCCDVYSSDRDNTDNSMFFHEGNLKENTGLGLEALIYFFSGVRLLELLRKRFIYTYLHDGRKVIQLT